nr:MAG TPA: hypothetical protein [Caudoviricetes sp.]
MWCRFVCHDDAREVLVEIAWQFCKFRRRGLSA